MTAPRVSIASQIAEVRREIAMRDSVYPVQVARGKMRQGEADLAVRHMTAVLATLSWLQSHEGKIRALLDGVARRDRVERALTAALETATGREAERDGASLVIRLEGDRRLDVSAIAAAIDGAVAGGPAG